jgi:hypothetical protein
MRTENPTLRITRWLRSRRQPIPFEAECSACADAQFKIKYDKRSEGGRCHGLIPPYGPPDRDRYLKILEQEFEEHLKVAHASEGDAKKSKTRPRQVSAIAMLVRRDKPA